MKKHARILLALVLVVLTIAGMSVTLFGAVSTPNNGWHTDENGVERYYENGSYVTGKQKIGEFTYLFADDGAFVRIVDDFQNVGTYGTMDTQAYKNAISALGSKVYLNMPINSSSVFYNEATGVTDNLSIGDKITKEQSVVSASSNTQSNYLFPSTYPGSGSADPKLNIALKKSALEFIAKGDDGDIALQIWQSTAGLDPFVNVHPSSYEVAADVVIDFEVKIGEGYAVPNGKDITFLQYIDRGHNGTSNNLFVQLLKLTAEGMVYSANYSTSKYVCKLTEDSYTRISAVVHPTENTYDIYVNGVLVLEGVVFVATPESWYVASAVQAKEFRIAHLPSWTEDRGASVCIDNVYVYGADKPVCTTDPEPKNGVYVEGGAYLRYYEDNKLVGGYRVVNGTFFGKTFSSESVAFDQYGKSFVGYEATMLVGAQVGKTESIDKNTFIAPDPIEVAGKTFIGWKVTHNGVTSFLAPGQSMRVVANLTYEPVAIKYELMDGASVRTNAESTGLRFMAQIAKNDYDMLLTLGLDVKTHIMIVPTEYIEKSYGYTTVEAFEDLEAKGYAARIDVAPNQWYYSTDNYYYYVGSVANILSENYMLEYSGIGYLEITDANGNTYRVYTPYDEKNNSRSVYEVASKAYNDRISGSKGTYSYKVEYKGNNTYSPYDNTRLGVIKGFVDKVVMLDVDENGVRSAGAYYEAPYELSVTGSAGEYSVTVKNKGTWSASNAVGVSLNGKKLGVGDYTKGDTSVSLSVKHDITDLKNYESATVNEWYMMNPAKSVDTSIFNGTGTFPTAAPNGETVGFVWNFSSKKTVTFFKSGSRSYLGWNRDGSYRYTAKSDSTAGCNVIDMSDWVTLEFSYYADASEVGSKFKVIFYSENPDTSGIDYYSYDETIGEAGWNNVQISRRTMRVDRTPLGWDKITQVAFVTTGWDMEDVNGSYNQSLYVTSMRFVDNNHCSINLTIIPQLENSAVFYPGGYAGIVNAEKFIINENDKVNATTFKDGDTYYLPLSVLATALADTATYYEGGNVLKMTYGGSEYRFTEGKTYTKGNSSVSLTKEAKVRGGRLFVSAKDVMDLFGYSEMYVDTQGLVVLSNTPNIFSASDSSIVYEITKEITFVRPAGQQVYNDLMEHSGGVHPYIMLNQADFDRLNYYKKVDSTLASYITTINGKYGVGSSKYTSTPSKYGLTDGHRLLATSREVLARVMNTALLYKLYEFDDPENAELLAERIWAELDAVCNFPDWHPAHYLDTAEMAYAVAIGYDWLYDYWESYDNANGTDRLGTMETAMYEYSLKTTSALPGGTYSYSLSASTNNWNGVCNGGTMAAALALVTNPTYQADAITVIDASIIGVEQGLWVYGPDGGYEEGPGYWAYGTTYLHVLMSALDSACGTNYGLYYTPGFAHSVYFTTYLGSMNTTWGFHDGGSGSADTKIAAWFAMKSGDGNVNAIRRQAIENGWKSATEYDVIWFSPHVINNSISLELDSYYSLDAIMTFRDSWDETKSIFTGLHGGDNAASHGDLDIGNFIISVNGTHLICDLGADKYNIAGYFGNYRWSYYRKRAEGQNTLVMLPHGESWDGKTGIPYADPVTNKEGSDNLPTPDQKKGAVSKCLRYETGKNSALGVIDMAPAFESYVASQGAIRGLWFKDDRSTIVIQDEGTYAQAMDIWWFAHTQGSITVSADGKSAIVERNGLCLYAELVTDIESATFFAMEAESLDQSYVGDTTPSDINPNTGNTYYKDDVESSRSGYRKLCVKAENVTEYKLAVVFKVISGETDIPEFGTTYNWTDIKDWKVD